MMKELSMNKDFKDVTLVNENKNEPRQASMISPCIPILKDISEKEGNSDQVMYLLEVFNFLRWNH